MNRSTTEIPKDMFKSLKTISLSLAALLLGAGSACGQQSDSYAHKVNTLIGTRGVGLTSGYLYPGATYPFGMVQFTPTYFAKRGGFVINQLSGGGCSHMGNFPTFPVTGKLDSSPENILDYRVGICGELGADVTLTDTFIKMGIDELSVSPSMILKVREQIRNSDAK